MVADAFISNHYWGAYITMKSDMYEAKAGKPFYRKINMEKFRKNKIASVFKMGFCKCLLQENSKQFK